MLEHLRCIRRFVKVGKFGDVYGHPFFENRAINNGGWGEYKEIVL